MSSKFYNLAVNTSAQQKAKIASHYGSVMKAAQSGSRKAIALDTRIQTSRNNRERENCIQQCSKYGKHTDAYQKCVNLCKDF